MKKSTLFLLLFLQVSVMSAQHINRSYTPRPRQYDYLVKKGSHYWGVFDNLYSSHWNYIPYSKGWDHSFMAFLGLGLRYDYAYRDNRTLGIETDFGISGDMMMDSWGSHRHSYYWQVKLLHTFHLKRIEVGLGPSMEWSNWWYVYDESPDEDGSLNEGFYGPESFSCIHYGIGPVAQIYFKVIPEVKFGVEYASHWMWSGAFRGKWEHFLAMKMLLEFKIRSKRTRR